MTCYSVLGLGYGDEGKGTIVDYLCSLKNVSYVIRFNGGPQAAHNVVSLDNATHTFSSFGSGMFHSNVNTHISNDVLIEPFNIMNEADVLINKGISNALLRLSIDGHCRVITPWNKMNNQMDEISRLNKKGTVGMGVGDVINDSATNNDVIYFSDLYNDNILKLKLKNIISNKKECAYKLLNDNKDHLCYNELRNCFSYFMKMYDINKVIDVYKLFITKGEFHKNDDDIYCDIISNNKNVVFEGAQGALLDCDYGFKPYVTKSHCNTSHLERCVGMYKDMLNIVNIGVIRGFYTRHGNGPFVTEINPGDNYYNQLLNGEDNSINKWQGKFRVGYFDMVMLKYALSFNNIDMLAITCLDRLKNVNIPICYAYDNLKPLYTECFNIVNDNKFRLDGYLKFINDNISCDINILSYGKKSNEKINLMGL